MALQTNRDPAVPVDVHFKVVIAAPLSIEALAELKVIAKNPVEVGATDSLASNDSRSLVGAATSVTVVCTVEVMPILFITAPHFKSATVIEALSFDVAVMMFGLQ